MSTLKAAAAAIVLLATGPATCARGGLRGAADLRALPSRRAGERGAS